MTNRRHASRPAAENVRGHKITEDTIRRREAAFHGIPKRHPVVRRRALFWWSGGLHHLGWIALAAGCPPDRRGYPTAERSSAATLADHSWF